ncbi:MAG: hypothetical protein ACI9CP_002079 [Cryomorphaceae bacterium]|jgi:hypothetical protein
MCQEIHFMMCFIILRIDMPLIHIVISDLIQTSSLLLTKIIKHLFLIRLKFLDYCFFERNVYWRNWCWLVFIGFGNISMLDKTERTFSWNTPKKKGDLTSIA